MSLPRLLTPPSAQPKTLKSLALRVYTAVLHLAPHKLAGLGNVCPWASAECIAACLNFAGRGGIGAGSIADIHAGRTNAIQLARVRKTREFFADFRAFGDRLAHEIARHERVALAHDLMPAIRLNATSDIQFEKVFPELFAMFPDVRFYDYTKAPFHKRPTDALPHNYHLTMSYSGHNADACLDALANGRNVAMVFDIRKGRPLPSRFGAHRVIDGDVTDARFMDPSPCIVGLRLKGRMTRAAIDASPFIVKAPYISVQED